MDFRPLTNIACTITDSMGTVATATVAATISSSADGSANAPVSTGNALYNTITTPKQGLAFSSMLVRYPVRPSWQVAGIDYPVGIDASKAILPLRDPSTIGSFIPGATYSGGIVNLPNTDNVTVDSFDFSLHNGVQLQPGTGKNCIIRNCYFKVGNNLFLPIYGDPVGTGFLIEKCVFDGNAPTFIGNVPGLTAGSVSVNGVDITIRYCYFLRGGAEHIVTGGSTKNGVNLTLEYNVFSQSGYGGFQGAHGDVVQQYGGIPGCSMQQVICNYNTVVIDDPNNNGDAGNGGWGMQGFSISSADNYGLDTKTFQFENNTICGAANSGVFNGLGAAVLVNSSWFTGTISYRNNYVDYNICNGPILGWAVDYHPESQNGPGGVTTDWGTGTNINLLTGASLQSRYGT